MAKFNRKPKALLIGVLSVVTGISTMFPFVTKKPIEPVKPPTVINKELIDLINETKSLLQDNKNNIANYKDLKNLNSLLKEANKFIYSPDKEAVKNIYDKLKAAKDEASSFVSEQLVLKELINKAKDVIANNKIPSSITHLLTDKILPVANDMVSGKGKRVDKPDLLNQEDEIKKQLEIYYDFIKERTRREKSYQDYFLNEPISTSVNEKYLNLLRKAKKEAAEAFASRESSLEYLDWVYIQVSDAYSNAEHNSDLLERQKQFVNDIKHKIENSNLNDYSKQKNYEALNNLVQASLNGNRDNDTLEKIDQALYKFEIKKYESEAEIEANAVLDTSYDITRHYDTSAYPDIKKANNELENILNNPNSTQEDIKKATNKVKEKVTEFVNAFNNEVTNTTSNFYNGWENLDLYNNEKANSDGQNASFIKDDLMGWNNTDIKEEIANISKQYFDNEEQESTLTADNLNDFKNKVDNLYKIDISDWSKPNIPGISQEEVRNKYLSVIYETTRVLRGHILKSLTDGAKFISASRYILPNNIWLQMMNKTFGYYAKDGKLEDENSSLKTIDETQIDEYATENGWFVPTDEKQLFTPNWAYMPTYNEDYPLFVEDSSKIYWTLYPYFQYAYLNNEILNPSIVSLFREDEEDDENYNMIFEKMDNANVDKDIYSKDMDLSEFLSEDAYKAFLKNQGSWFDPSQQDSNYKDQNKPVEENGSKFEFNFDIFKFFINYPFSSSQSAALAKNNISSLNVKYFNEAVIMFNDLYQKQVEEIREKLETKKAELEKDSTNNSETLAKINSLLETPKYEEVNKPLMDKYSYFNDSFISKANELLKDN
ncbi:hypothetical protein FJO69_02115 [[Mycoplasma] falconis]|uniref:Uncharacterized protein n=1 Tax=[Mycoplasma] falconis TaxID=92403 RepID=A0A501X9V8_9BACT|nr:hypothetical protein [[Mycoplasma] falconis]TPE57281.1 hypothetical protein FJO69_02115 [[Mycoplasma] falconis]